MDEMEKRNKRIQKDIDRMLAKGRREERIATFLRLFGKKPMQYKRIKVADWDEQTKYLTNFRKAYGDYFGRSGIEENSKLQSYSTQMLWHRLDLQKRRMNRLGVTMQLESERVKRDQNPKLSVDIMETFDGRYALKEINEAIYSKRSFFQGEKALGEFRDFDSINYSVLSAKQQGKKEIICPNCGCTTTRNQLIDGCDYCGTKFTIEDLEDRVGGFDYMVEIAREGATKERTDFRRREAGLTGTQIRKFDPNFSFQSFRSNLYNKMAAIHFAESFRQISAFAADDLSHLLGTFDEVVNIDFESFYLWDNNFWVEDGLQKIKCTVHMVLFGLVDGQIKLRNEAVGLELAKAEECKTQNICGPSMMKCKSCGTSITLMDGKSCPYCGRELDLKQYDWVITKYDMHLSDYGKSWRVFN